MHELVDWRTNWFAFKITDGFEKKLHAEWFFNGNCCCCLTEVIWFSVSQNENVGILTTTTTVGREPMPSLVVDVSSITATALKTMQDGGPTPCPLIRSTRSEFRFRLLRFSSSFLALSPKKSACTVFFLRQPCLWGVQGFPIPRDQKWKILKGSDQLWTACRSNRWFLLLSASFVASCAARTLRGARFVAWKRWKRIYNNRFYIAVADTRVWENFAPAFHFANTLRVCAHSSSFIQMNHTTSSMLEFSAVSWNKTVWLWVLSKKHFEQYLLWCSLSFEKDWKVFALRRGKKLKDFRCLL